MPYKNGTRYAGGVSLKVALSQGVYFWGVFSYDHCIRAR